MSLALWNGVGWHLPSARNTEENKKMLIRIYLTLWALYAMFGLTFLATGNLTLRAGVVFGFVAGALVFVGMLSVVPTMAAHPAPAIPAEPAEKALQPAVGAARAKAFNILKSA